LAVAIYAVEQTPLDAPLHIVCTSNALAEMITDKVPDWEDRGWIDVALEEHMRTLLNKLRRRCAPTTFRRAVKPTDLKVLGAARQQVSEPDPQIFKHQPYAPLSRDSRFEVTGARLARLTQSIAYKGILSQKSTAPRKQTEVNIAAIRRHEERNGPITSATIWSNARHKDFTRPFAVFLWKCIHGALKCGNFWFKIPNYEDRAQCSFCGEIESLPHILFECTATGQRDIWEMTATIWRKKNLPWITPTVETIHTLAITEWTNDQNKTRPGANRLWRILVSEAAHLIWKLRCERVIGHETDREWTHTKTHVRRKFMYVLNNRLAMDVEATRKKYGKLAQKADLVLATWNGTIFDELALPEDWTRCKGFLVGSSPALRLFLDPG
ncbi:uncharacterized protein B0H18DRAFT_896059, partial [Fomitopsis serialis]|uniref:uncharacterized protein n=1 Tax=Fomitopsis serialis TaxID=139415 RepID=UPI0020080161